jgi:TolA-binding protein
LLRIGEIQATKLKLKEEAISTYNRIASEYPDSTMQATEAHQRAGKLYENGKEYEKAIDQYMAIHENYPGTEGALENLGKCAVIYDKKLKQKDKAIEILNTIIKEFPESKNAKRAAKRIKKLNK